MSRESKPSPQLIDAITMDGLAYDLSDAVKNMARAERRFTEAQKQYEKAVRELAEAEVDQMQARREAMRAISTGYELVGRLIAQEGQDESGD